MSLSDSSVVPICCVSLQGGSHRYPGRCWYNAVLRDIHETHMYLYVDIILCALVRASALEWPCVRVAIHSADWVEETAPRRYRSVTTFAATIAVSLFRWVRRPPPWCSLKSRKILSFVAPFTWALPNRSSRREWSKVKCFLRRWSATQSVAGEWWWQCSIARGNGTLYLCIYLRCSLFFRWHENKGRNTFGYSGGKFLLR